MVHFKVIPLEVLAVWNRPAVLSVDSEPAGASAFLDGRTLPGKTPLTVEVKRDRVSHRIELSHPGYIVGETSLRFDRTVSLQATVRLDAEPPPPPPAEPTPSPTSVPPPTTGSMEASGAAGTASAAQSADGARGKRVKSEHKAGKGAAHARTAEAKAARKAARSHKSKAAKAAKSRSKSARASKKGAHSQDAAPSGELF